MTREDNDPPSGGAKGFLQGELGSLIDALRRLQMQVASVLLQRRLEPGAGTGHQRDEGADIRGAVDRQVQKVGSMPAPVRSTAADLPPGEAAPAEEPAPEGSGTAAEPSAVAADNPGSPAVPGVLASHFRGGGAAAQQNLSESLQAKTTQHLNQAIRAVRSRDFSAARLHADLAQSAMQAASEFMGEEDYLAFKKAVEERVQAMDLAE